MDCRERERLEYEEDDHHHVASVCLDTDFHICSTVVAALRDDDDNDPTGGRNSGIGR